MKLQLEEFLYLLKELEINLLDKNNSKIIKNYYLKNINIFENIKNPKFTEKLIELLYELRIPITNQLKNKALETINKIIKTKQEITTSIFPFTREELIEQVMKELQIKQGVAGYYLIKQSILLLIEEEQKEHDNNFNLLELATYLAYKLKNIPFQRSTNLNAKNIHSIISKLIHETEKNILENKPYTDSAIFIYKNYTFPALGPIQFLFQFKNYIQLLEEKQAQLFPIPNNKKSK